METTQQNPIEHSQIRVVSATTKMQTSIVKLLEGFNNPGIHPDNWRHFLEYPWRDNSLPYGYVLLDGVEIIGFIATIFSPKIYGYGLERTCNISSWILKKNYRGRGLGLKLIDELLKIPDCTINNMSPSASTISQLRKRGFMDLETSQTILTPLSAFGNIGATMKMRVTDDNKTLQAELPEEDRRIFEDHISYPCRHFLLSSKKDSCYGLYRVNVRGRYPIATIHHLSNPAFFAKGFGALALWLLQKSGVLKFSIDSRLLEGAFIFGSRIRPPNNIKLYRPGSIPRRKISNAYSESVLLP